MNRIYDYCKTKEYDKALEILFDLYKSDTDKKAEICLEIAKIYFYFLNDTKQSLCYLTCGLEHAACSFKGFFYFEIGKIKNQNREYDSAIENLEKALSFFNSDDDMYIYTSLLLSKIYADIHKYGLSGRIMNSLEKNNKFIADKEKYGYVNCMQRYPGNYDFGGDYNKLIGIYKEILAGNPGDNQILCFLAQTYNYLGLYDKTIELYEDNSDKVKDSKFFENKFLNEYEIASGKIVLQSKPRNLMVVLSNKCNLKCIMCRAIENKWELPEERLEEVKKLFPYLERVLWQGGEVLFMPYFKDILRESLEYPNIKQAVLTNFQLADNEILNLIVKNGIELRISIDGVTKEMYEKIRAGGSFEKLCLNLEELHKIRSSIPNNMSLNMNVVVMRENYKQLALFADFAKKYYFDFITLAAIEYDLSSNSSEKERDFKLRQDIFSNPVNDELEYMSYQIMLLKQKTERYGIQLEVRFETAEITDDMIKQYDVNNGNSEKQKKSEIKTADMRVEENNSLNKGARKDEPVNSPALEENTDNAENNTGSKMLCHLPWNTLTLYYDGSVRPDCLCDIDKLAGHLSKDKICDIWNNKYMQNYRSKIFNKQYEGFCSAACICGRVVESYLKFL